MIGKYKVIDLDSLEGKTKAWELSCVSGRFQKSAAGQLKAKEGEDRTTHSEKTTVAGNIDPGSLIF